MTGRVCLRAGLVVLAVAGALPPQASAQPAGVFKVAYYNIKSGKGQVGLTGPATFVDTGNCTDPSQPLNAWGTGLVQAHLATLAADPSVVALGLGESWTTVCGSPENVRLALGWKARTSERNGVAMVARHGFTGVEEWVQLDTSLNLNPADTMWVLKRDVCLDEACAQSIPVFVAHWLAAGPDSQITFERQAQQTVGFLARAGGAPHVLVGDLNVWEGTGQVCSQFPNNTALASLRAAGYVDAWPLLHGTAEGYTGMLNRAGCGTPLGYAWKRIDYAFSLANFAPLSMTRFGIVPAGREAPSDHYGIIAAYPWAGAPPAPDTMAPQVNLTSPVAGQVSAGAQVLIDVAATDDVGVVRVEVLEDGVVAHTLTAPPYRVTCNQVTAVPGTRVVTARAFDAAGNLGTSTAVHLVVNAPATAPPPAQVAAGEIVLYAKNAPVVAGNWHVVPAAAAAGGAYLWNPDAALPRPAAAAAQPLDYFELTFTAVAGVPYRIWMRGRAERDHWANDSAFFQFSGTVTSTGMPIYRIGTTSATWLGVEDCSGCVLRQWGWNDNGYNGMGPLLYFAVSGPQTLRVQRREDGLGIDQIVLSPAQFLLSAPGAPFDDATILSAAPAPPPPVSAAEILITADMATTVSGGWRLLADASAARGTALGHPDAGAPKLGAALAAPEHYVEFTFTAEAGRAYRLWIRGRADRDHWGNDSVFIQFDRGVTTAGQPAARIGTTDSYTVNLEEGVGWGLAAWGWQDNGYGAGVLGPLIAFETSGLQTIRIQTREDGLRIDQVVLSSQRYLTAAPGALRNDTTILR